MYLKYKIQQSIGIFKIKYILIVVVNMPQKFEPVYTLEFYDFNFKTSYCKLPHTVDWCMSV